MLDVDEQSGRGYCPFCRKVFVNLIGHMTRIHEGAGMCVLCKHKHAKLAQHIDSHAAPPKAAALALPRWSVTCSRRGQGDGRRVAILSIYAAHLEEAEAMALTFVNQHQKRPDGSWERVPMRDANIECKAVRAGELETSMFENYKKARP